jgi:hypothetical protein
MIEISMTEILIPSPHPSPQWGEGKDGGRFGYLKLEIGICLGFGICNLGFHTLCSMLYAPCPLRSYGTDRILSL